MVLFLPFLMNNRDLQHLWWIYNNLYIIGFYGLWGLS